MCRAPGCDRDSLGTDAPAGVLASMCSAQCDVRYDHLKDDARGAMLADRYDDEPDDHEERGFF